MTTFPFMLAIPQTSTLVTKYIKFPGIQLCLREFQTTSLFPCRMGASEFLKDYWDTDKTTIAAGVAYFTFLNSVPFKHVRRSAVNITSSIELQKMQLVPFFILSYLLNSCICTFVIELYFWISLNSNKLIHLVQIILIELNYKGKQK